MEFVTQGTLMICMICGVVGLTLWWLKFQKSLDIRLPEAIILAVLHFAVGVVVMKLWAILEAGGNLEKAANMRLYGAMFLMPPLYYLWAKFRKRNIPLFMDTATICLLIGLAVGRINCLSSGCCEGVRIAFGSDMRWPLREIELIYCSVFIISFGRKIIKNKTYGDGLPLLMVSYGTIRFIMEWVREEYTGRLGIFHLAHIWSLICILIGAVMYYIVRKNFRPGGSRRENAESRNLAKGGK